MASNFHRKRVSNTHTDPSDRYQKNVSIFSRVQLKTVAAAANYSYAGGVGPAAAACRSGVFPQTAFA